MEVAVLGSPSLIVRTVSADVKQHLDFHTAPELCDAGLCRQPILTRQVTAGHEIENEAKVC